MGQESVLGLLIFIGAASSGFVCFFLLLRLMPFLEKKEALAQKKELLEEAKKQKKHILSTSQEQSKENVALLVDELEEVLSQRSQEQSEEEAELSAQESTYLTNEAQVVELERESQEKQRGLKANEESITHLKQKVVEVGETLTETFAKHANVDFQKQEKKLVDEQVSRRYLESQRTLRLLTEELTSSSRKKAIRLLDRTLNRYAPSFYWPKPLNIVEFDDPSFFEKISGEASAPLEALRECSQVTIQAIPSERDPSRGSVKVVGGYGISKESARLALEDLKKNGRAHCGKLTQYYQTHFKRLEQEAYVLGRKAVDQLQLEGIHPEVEKLVGALNWRTSYRQNQWYHTVEVATLAGVLASELGINVSEAKRVGLLHDIGKTLDYRIEGSHAVISADYADRYGERRTICDTVMSHHADLIVETPLAYVLCAADSLSGGRPGARVNLEEGYQIRLSAMQEAIHSFAGIIDAAIMNGGREVHIQVDPSVVKESQLQALTKAIAKKIEEEVAYPGQIKVMLIRTYESVAVA